MLIKIISKNTECSIIAEDCYIDIDDESLKIHKTIKIMKNGSIKEIK